MVIVILRIAEPTTRLDLRDFVETILGTLDADPPINPTDREDLKPTVGFPIPVRSDGKISLPHTKPIYVRGLRLSQVEEAVRNEQEARVLGRHDRVVLYPDVVGEAERVPHGHVGVGHRAIAGGVGRQALTSVGLGRVGTGGVAGLAFAHDDGGVPVDRDPLARVFELAFLLFLSHDFWLSRSVAGDRGLVLLDRRRRVF